MKRLLFLLLLCFLSLKALEPIAPLPATLDDVDLEKAKLGRLLFFDPILSSDKSVSCHSCHNFTHGGADPRPVSLGVYKRSGNIQSPTVYNSRYNFKQFWNGRASSLKEQAGGPLMSHTEMNMSAQKIEERLNNNSSYQKAFKTLYGHHTVSYNDVIDALVMFEKALVTPNSRFDRYLRGEISLTEKEKEGYDKFKSLGCITCHNGINIGSNAFQKMGLFKAYPYDKRYPYRFAVTGQPYHKNVFKVPSLRNISLTAPYFHDGKAKTLEAAIDTMGRFNLGVKLSKKDISLLSSFLKSLEGERPKILDMP